jgi:DNA-binding CsgD family transcriptional regulator
VVGLTRDPASLLGPELVGREKDEDRLSQLLMSAREGLSGSVVLRGDPGVGKTALLEGLARLASDMHILRLGGIESEMELPYAALHRLLLPMLPRCDRLPPPQRDALGAAFGIVSGRPPDKFLVGLGALTLIAEAAVAGPVLCAIDDAQWIDHESTAVLAFVARRLLAEGVVMVFCVRDSPAPPGSLSGLAEHILLGLSDDDALALLDRTRSGVDRTLARRIVAEAGGNPLAIIEFARSLTSAQMAGQRFLAAPLPIAHRLETHFREQVLQFPPDAQTLLLIASAEPSGQSDLIWRASIRLGVTPDDLAGIGFEGLLSLTPEITFRHPLIRSAVYNTASPNARRQVHDALAKATDESDRDRRSWHRSAAVTGPDEEVATELEQAAERARGRGGLAAETAFLIRAGELTGEPIRRGPRILAAARACSRAGDLNQAQALLDWAIPDLTTPLDKAQAQWLQGAIYAELGSMGDAADVIAWSAKSLEEIRPALAHLAWLESLDASISAFRLTKVLSLQEIARDAIAAPSTPGIRTTPAESMLRGLATRLAVGPTEAIPLLQEVFSEAVASDHFLDSAVPPVLYSHVISELWDWDRGKEILFKIAERERSRGGLVALRLTLHSACVHEAWTGRFSMADAYRNEALDISAAIGGDFLGEHMNFELRALQGDDAGAEQSMAIVLPLAEGAGYGCIRGMCLTAKCIMNLARGHYEEAAEHASILFDNDPIALGTRILPDLIEAACRSGRPQLAQDALDRLEVRANASGTFWARSVLARSRALLAPEEEADALYQMAIHWAEKANRPLDVARGRLVRGEWLRRQRQRLKAREELRAAHELFISMGALGFAERVAGELRATGAHARRRSREAANDLTAQESQVARLAATGAINREIATELYLSEATVAYHLRKVFRKLSVTSRRQLPRALADSTGRTDQDPPLSIP